jgi:pimeloyl-ACP methyl ester carboxylesterase
MEVSILSFSVRCINRGKFKTSRRNRKNAILEIIAPKLEVFMESLYSNDGTTIAYEKAGSGPPLILVDGALCSRTNGPNGPLAVILKQHFTVFTYDRRGRGDSGDNKPYDVEREIEDLSALIQEAGGSAYVYGISSGAALALESANRRIGFHP